MARQHYLAGDYYVKSKGRGVCRVTLTKSQAKALFELMHARALEFEEITYIDYFTPPNQTAKL